MIRLLLISFIIFYSPPILAQVLNDRPFFVLKLTPTSLFNPNTGTLMAGMEIWPSNSFNLQYEYGHPCSVFSEEEFHPNKEDRIYRKHKFGARFHYFPSNIRNKWWRLGRRSWLPPNRRSFVGADVILIPQSFTDLKGAVVLEDGTPVYYASALLYKNAVAATAVFGSQVPVGKKFLLEAYIGFGLKWMNVKHDLSSSFTLPVVSGSIWQAGGFSFDQRDGQVVLPYLDLGIKVVLKFFANKYLVKF